MEEGLDTPGPGALKGHSLNRRGCFFRIHVPEKAPGLQREHPQRAFWLLIGLLFSCPHSCPHTAEWPPASPFLILPHIQHNWGRPGAPPARVAGPGALVTPGEPFGRALQGLMGSFIDQALQSGFCLRQLSAWAPRRGESIQPPGRACWERTSG